MSQAPRSDLFDAPAETARRLLRLYFAVLVVFAVLYAATAQRGPAWQDSGIFQWRIVRFDVFGWLGLALSHPLLIVLGKAFSYLPFGPAAWRINLVSALAGAVAAANVALLVRRLCPRPRAAAWIAAGFFGLAHTTWWLATICESQLLLAALFTAQLNLLLSLLRRPCSAWAGLLGLAAGLALTAHDLALLAVPAYAAAVVVLCARRRMPWSALGSFATGYVLGAGGFLLMVGFRAWQEGLASAVASALFGNSWRGDVLGGTGKAAAMGAGYVAYNFPNLALPLAILGLGSLRRLLPKGGGWIGAYLLAAYLLFPIRYTVPDQFMFFLPFYALVSIAAGVGAARLAASGRRRWLMWLTGLSVLAAPVLYAAAPSIWRAARLPLPGRKDLPYRDPARYWLTPWKCDEDSAGRFARTALTSVPAGGVLIADGTAMPSLLWVQHLERAGQSVRLLGIGEADRAAIPPGTPNVFVVSGQSGYYPRWLDDVATLRKVGPDGIVCCVVWKGEPPSP